MLSSCNLFGFCWFPAERQGFEPWEQLPVHRISSAARSTTPASLQGVNCPAESLSANLHEGRCIAAFVFAVQRCRIFLNPTRQKRIFFLLRLFFLQLSGLVFPKWQVSFFGRGCRVGLLLALECGFRRTRVNLFKSNKTACVCWILLTPFLYLYVGI